MAESGTVTTSSVHATVIGKVQGVGFRYFVMRKANGLGLVGYVRNSRTYNRLEIVAEGRRDRLDDFLKAVRRGPPGARVDDLRSIWGHARYRYDAFRINPT
ncbi:MAG: acylphosphatase [Chloroflexi bacterium]|nr:acylphosphatase [Chloroflexota bacterium]